MRKDNYSWLDKIDYIINVGVHLVIGDREMRLLLTDQAKQTIISQIEIEKLRARIDTVDFMIAEMILPQNKHGFVKDYLAELQEKLKELEK